MPRKVRKTLAEVVSAAILSLPFAFDADATAPTLFANLPDADGFDADEIRVGIAAQIAADRAAGLSGNDLRTKYSGVGCPTNAGLSGPMRRKVLRAYGHGSLVARSYSQYADGSPRKGSGHAATHGPLAAERAAAAMQVLADEYAQTISLSSAREMLRQAGRKVPTVRKGDESNLRAAVAALRIEEMRESVA